MNIDINKKLVSVIIPVYKTEEYLRMCVDSVLRQTYGNLEIILVNDGSPDGCPSICDEYAVKDDRVKVIHKTNGGISDARNAGLSSASGEYIYFVDSDDYIAENAVEQMYNICEANNADFIFINGTVIYKSGEKYGIKKNKYISKKKFETCGGIEFLAKVLSYRREYIPGVQFYFIRADYIKKHEIKFYKGIIHEDQLFTFLLFINDGRAAHYPERLYYRRVRKNSIMTGLKQNRHESFSGYYRVLCEMIKERENRDNLTWRYAKKAVSLSIRRMFFACCYTYILMKRRDKRAAASEKKALLTLLKRGKI